MASIAPARAAAHAALLQVERGTAHSDDALHSPAVTQLTRRDRDLTTELVLGTLRWELVLDDEIARRLSRPEADMHLGVITALRLGAYQLLFLDRIPPHAAIGEAVEQARQADGEGAASLTNAVLRRMLRESAPKPQFDPAAAHPTWMVRRWQRFYGAETAAAICASNQSPAPATIRLLPDAQLTGEQLAPGQFLTSARTSLAGDACSAGRFQDEASQLVGELAALYASQSEGPTLDACAAPGGKTAILLERTQSAHITALEISHTRLRALTKRLAHPRLTLQAGDARTLPAASYDTVLCDVPCSGTGTLARNPEIRSRLSEADLPKQAERQRAILTSALAALRPGGTLVYSTCSLEPEENEQVVSSATSNSSSYEIIPASQPLDELLTRDVLTPAGHTLLQATALSGPYLRTLQGKHKCDGFFAAILRRTR